MIQIYKTIDGQVKEIEKFEQNCWIRIIDPTDEEIEDITNTFNIEEDFIRAALDRQETSRVEQDDEAECSLITLNLPRPTDSEDNLIYETIPIGIIETQFCVVTVCLEKTPELMNLINGRIKHVFTNLKTRFILQIIYSITISFINYLRTINRKSNDVEARLHVSMDNKQLFQMLDLEKSTVYFSTALKSNQLVIEKLERGRVLKLYEDDSELLEDILIEVDQAISMCNIYSNILSGTMDAFASIISNNLNIVMKVLTAITILMSIPTMISSFYGMNVSGLPFPHFYFVFILTIIATILVFLLLYRFKMFQ